MKKILLITLILISIMGFSQNGIMPKINWQGKTATENSYIDLLNLKDRNSLIVKIGYSSYWTNGTNSEFIIYQNDGKVRRFKVYQPNTAESKTKIRRKKIKKSEYQYYWNYLNVCINENKLEIDKSRLNISEKKGKEEGTIMRKMISDGADYHFEICQNNNYIAYSSYEPKEFIADEYPGFEERQKLLDLMNGFEKLTEKY